ncbi:hypothetical protein Kpol_1048p4 [Vanderwaltozyma polyspora DSM 70294]|uniref:DNA-directed RNA polymerase III subunit n=1 Tax=Vanderwaltozyma polyspora (strain ATCC 22028 / DSM 70294 / BCRC 21397 / CBS 2163 / NBRC 10782 / NRRL Y-8283 / UCD 57-17) TaxID=436907 RepID=A7TGG7_VANPO|nr:uncharacterized protein Kpol_1048p4 [Vanderwaltozyma polyspora DSM 70294]EDO18574.1 hypothetical protein Kpol_1048p4 [Vanderwaltozyma polyspora DSM 70294]
MSFRRGGGGTGSSFSNLPFGLGYHDIVQNSSNEMPTIPLPVNNPVSNRERSLAVTYIKFSQTVRDSPFYTGSIDLSIQKGDDSKKKSKSKRKRSEELIDESGLLDGIERYSDKYLKKRKIGVSISEHPFNPTLFPKELYSTMGLDKKKLLVLSSFNNKDDIFTGNGEDDSKGLSMLEKLKELAEDMDDENNGEQEGDKDDNLDDDDFDDESEDDDYNAEKYFDDGDEDFAEDDYGDEPAF